MSPVLNNVKIFLYAPIFHPRCGNLTLSRALVIFVDNCENCRYFDQGVNHMIMIMIIKIFIQGNHFSYATAISVGPVFV